MFLREQYDLKDTFSLFKDMQKLKIDMGYYWLSITLIALYILFLLVTIFLKNEKIVAIILVTLSLIILPWKIIEFSYYGLVLHNGTYPIEISHISYFVFSIIILSGIKRLYFTAGTFAFLSGVGYMIGGIVSPKTILTTLEFHIVIMGIASHMILVFGGMLTLFKYQKYNIKEFYFPIIGLGFALFFAYLVEKDYIYPDATGLNNLVIIKLINGSILSYLGIDSSDLILNWSVTILLFILVGIVIFIMNLINNKVFYTRRNNRVEIGVYPLVRSIRKYKA